MSRVSASDIAVGECLTKIARQPKVKTTDYLESGAFPVIDQGTKFVGGYVNDESLLYTGPLPVVIFGDHNRHIKFVKSPFAVGADGTQLLYPDKRFDITYFYYAIRALPLKNYGYERHFQYLKEERLRVWPRDVQRRIAAILSAYDDLIENNTRRIAILEEMARRIYEEWFECFRFPGHEGVRMVESELGLVPEGWRIGTVADVAVVYRGRSYKGTELADFGGRPFVNLKCMERDGGFRASGLKRYTGQFKESHTVRPGDMVMGITDMTQERRIVARVGRVSGLDADLGVFSMDLVRIASRGEYAEPYLYAMFRWSGFADEVKQHANGANVLHLLPARIEEFAFARPTPELAAKFAELFAPMLSLCDKLERKKANLQATRDLLLPKLISGELDVSAVSEPEALAA